MANSFKFTDNSPAVLSAMKSQLEAALTECGERALGYAEMKAPAGTPETTHIKGYHGGNLRKSLTFKVKGQTCYVGTNLKSPEGAPYPVYVELGTGKYYEGEGGRHSPWSFKDKNGKIHNVNGMKLRHFLRDSIQDHREEYIRVLKKWLKGG